MTQNNPSVGGYMATVSETAGFPQIFNIEADPKERLILPPMGGDGSWGLT